MIETKIESDAPKIRLCDSGNAGIIEARLAHSIPLGIMELPHP